MGVWLQTPDGDPQNDSLGRCRCRNTHISPLPSLRSIFRNGKWRGSVPALLHIRQARCQISHRYYSTVSDVRHQLQPLARLGQLRHSRIKSRREQVVAVGPVEFVTFYTVGWR